MIAADNADARAGAIVVRGNSMVAAVCALFERIWESATPIGDAPPRPTCELPAVELEVARLLAEGCTDEAIARKLGVSPRTARRLAADLMDRLGARSRFEAGVRAVQDGWLPVIR